MARAARLHMTIGWVIVGASVAVMLGIVLGVLRW